MKVEGQHRPQGLQGGACRGRQEAGEAGKVRPCALRDTVKMLVLPVRAKRGR